MNPRCALPRGVAGYALDISPDDIVSEARGSAEAAFARQVAAYLCHTAFEWRLSRIATAFGCDRSTVAHACHAIEDRRDEPTFDMWISGLEAALREAADAAPPAMKS